MRKIDFLKSKSKSKPKSNSSRTFQNGSLVEKKMKTIAICFKNASTALLSLSTHDPENRAYFDKCFTERPTLEMGKIDFFDNDNKQTKTILEN